MSERGRGPTFWLPLIFMVGMIVIPLVGAAAQLAMAWQINRAFHP